MRHIDKRDFQLLLNPFQLGLHILAKAQIKRPKRFVQQQNPRTAHQSARNGDPLLLSARERRARPPLKAAEVDEFEHLHHAAADLLFGELLQPQPEGHVFKNVEMREQRVSLKDGVDLALIGRQIVDAHALKVQVARSGRFKTADDSQCRRLAAAGGTEQRDELLVMNSEVDRP